MRLRIRSRRFVRKNTSTTPKKRREVRIGNMGHLGRHILILGLVFLAQIVSAEGVQVQATVDRNQVGIEEVINLIVAGSAQDSIQVEEPHLPPLSGFDLINSSSSVETRSSFVNGKFLTTQSRNFVYMLAVSQKGVLTIPEIPVVVEGKSYKTQAIKISATNARSQSNKAQPPPGQNGFQEMDEMEELFNQM